jgi:cytochrome c-type biogenesis protein CcmE
MRAIRKKRLALIFLMVSGVGIAVGLVLMALNENINHFYDPSAIKAGEAPLDRNFRVGGMVVEGSVSRQEGLLEVSFDLTDFTEAVTVRYDGILPDLFREGQGIVAMGMLGGDGIFVAQEVLAKHDEEYMPPEVFEALQRAELARQQQL